LVIELGFFQFQQIFTLVNMNSTIQTIVQRSLSQRMAESLQGNNWLQNIKKLFISKNYSYICSVDIQKEMLCESKLLWISLNSVNEKTK